MKILIISNLYPPFVRGGAEIVAARMAEGLGGHLQHVVVVTTRPFSSLSSLLPERFGTGALTIYRFFPLNLYHYLDQYRFPYPVRALWRLLDIFNLHAAWVVYRIVRVERPHVVITHNLTGIGMLHPLTLALLKIRHIHIIHDVQLVAPSGIIVRGAERSALQRLYNAFGYPFLMRLLFSKVSAVISPSRFLLDFYTNRGFFKKTQAQVLPNPVQLPAVASERTEHPELRVLYIGQISKAKGVALLIDAVRSIARSELTLTLVGSGIESAELAERAATDPRIEFTGWRSRAELEVLLRSADCMVVPSILYDNSPTAVYEALSFGVPAVVSDIGGATEIIRNNYNGWVVEAGNEEQLAVLLSDLARDRDRVARAAAHARESVADLSIERYTAALLTVCQNDTR